jgi:hypothetical protein
VVLDMEMSILVMSYSVHQVNPNPGPKPELIQEVKLVQSQEAKNIITEGFSFN